MGDESAGAERGDLVRLVGWDRAASPSHVAEAGPAALEIFEHGHEQAVVHGVPLKIEAFLNRDFMPILEEADGRPLMAVIHVHAVRPRTRPALLSPDWLAVRFGKLVWMTAGVLEQPPNTFTGMYPVVARGGPKWGPGVLADVLVQLRDSDGCVFRLRVSDCSIDRSD